MKTVVEAKNLIASLLKAYKKVKEDGVSFSECLTFKDYFNENVSKFDAEVICFANCVDLERAYYENQNYFELKQDGSDGFVKFKFCDGVDVYSATKNLNSNLPENVRASLEMMAMLYSFERFKDKFVQVQLFEDDNAPARQTNLFVLDEEECQK